MVAVSGPASVGVVMANVATVCPDATVTKSRDLRHERIVW